MAVPLPDSALLTVGEVQKLTDLSVYKIVRLCDRGVLVADRTEGGHRRITASSVDAYLASPISADRAVAS